MHYNVEGSGEALVFVHGLSDSLLFWEPLASSLKNDYQVIDGYRLAFVNYKFNQRYLLDKFDRQMLRDIPVERVSDKFMYAYIQRNSYAQAILDVYGIDAEKSMNYIELTLRLYLVYKTFSIAEKYPQYGHFKPLGNVNNAFKNNPNQHELRMVRELAEMISQRETHIELKIHQTINLIRRLDTFKNKRVFERPITYDEMCTLLGVDTNCDSILQRMQTLPPPLFEPSIYLIKNDVYNSIIETTSDERVRKRLIERNVISLSELSSGERQFIYTTSTLLYHALNIQSISPIDRVAYRSLCLVLEEVEICFHPEYQRTFINSLLSLLARTGLNKAFGICVVVVTHSPFVLSDMPKGNILYLDEGDGYHENGSDMLAKKVVMLKKNHEYILKQHGFDGVTYPKKIFVNTETSLNSENNNNAIREI